jgi:Na+/H+-dicarboxylate symporter
MGLVKPFVGVLLRTCYAYNPDGSAIYLTMAAIFIAQAMNIDLTLTDQLVLLGVLLFTSKGSAGVAGAGFVALAATLASMHKIPVTGLVLLLGVDRFLNEARALTNLVGNGVATVVVARWERVLDLKQARAVLERGSALPVDTTTGTVSDTTSVPAASLSKH